MAEQITQENRLLAVHTPAGQDVLLISSFAGSESISQPFRYTVKMVADVQNNKPAQVKQHDLVGKAFTVRIKLSEPGSGADAGERYICGFCERFSKDSQDDNFAYYTAAIVPWFSFLNYGANCRIFQDKSVPDIIKQVVEEMGYSAYLQMNLTKTYTVWDYCVQYRETDFAFISRLMEHEGIFYFFEHSNGKHVMVLCDSPSGYKALPEQATFVYAPAQGQDTAADTIRTWSIAEQIHTGKHTMRDFHHEMPHNFMEVTEQSPEWPMKASSSSCTTILATTRNNSTSPRRASEMYGRKERNSTASAFRLPRPVSSCSTARRGAGRFRPATRLRCRAGKRPARIF